ncbi:outer membrane beta-barrel protein [Lishizhenia sp.]|uniref:outer membrane beta-barrel protein n=1 Tax=Lishizhenia sp. TaxID=2497594 RepID=UPI00299DAA33|nr:outer membrane beta-barrel protein [Lishizhenia sp.]MDX1445528.1 outer membrane beta-barrel protein [Lishizhenia sp.]
MKRIYKLLLVCTAMISVSTTVEAQSAPREGDIILNPYYGGPNFGKNLFSNSTIEVNDNEIQSVNTTTTGLGPMGLRGGYMLSDKVMIGLDVIYNGFTTEYTYTKQNDPVVYNGRLTMNRVRVQARFNFNFETSSNVFKPYFGAGIGYNGRFWTIEDNGQNIQEGDVNGLPAAILPVSARIAFGSNFFITDQIAINGEIGLGGPVLSAGLTFKL